MLIDQYVDGVYDPADILAMSLALQRVCNALEIRPTDLPLEKRNCRTHHRTRPAWRAQPCPALRPSPEGSY